MLLHQKTFIEKNWKIQRQYFFLYQKCLSPNMCWTDDIIWPMYEKQFCILIYVTSDYSFRSIVENPQQILRPTPHLAQLHWQWCRIKKNCEEQNIFSFHHSKCIYIKKVGFLAKNPEYKGSKYFHCFPN